MKRSTIREWRIVVVVAAGLITGTAVAQTSPGLSGSDAGLPGASQPPAAAVARLDARMTQLEQDLRGLTGKVETLSFQLRQLNDRVDRLGSDMEMQLGELKGNAGRSAATASPSTATPPTPPPAGGGGPTVLSRPGGGSEPAPPATPPAQSTPSAPAAAPSSSRGTLPAGSSKEQYAYAFSLMQKASYVEATAAFSEFLQQHADDPLADNARYWLGESYYARSEYARAAETFLDAYEQNKTGPKAPDTLLKLGMTLGKLDKKKEACASFRELGRAFPNATAQIKDKAAQESQKLGCS